MTTTIGQLLLLASLITACYGAFASAAGWRLGRRGFTLAGAWAAAAAFAALTAIAGLLTYALIVRDFGFAYVAGHSSASLVWYYAISALWVGQSGSLLLWTWLLAAVTMVFRFWPATTIAATGTVPDRTNATACLREPAFVVLMVCLSFLVSLMVFGADPMEPSLSAPRDGAGMAPALQHPAMLVHPPIVFLAYALWTVPFALGVAALVTGRLDDAWVRAARPWAILAWSVLGGGILLGAVWAYEELGWGGYWGWDPVENGSLIPWLTGTALIHTGLAWRSRGVFKRSTLLLAVATFGLCNFAAFLTRSGIFGSVHEFSRSPLGWMFLAMMAALCLIAVALMIFRNRDLAPDRRLAGLSSRESFVALAAIALTAMAMVTLVGTSLIPISDVLLGRRITVGPSFYNNALMPVALVLLATTAAAPLLRWGAAPSGIQRTALWASAAAGLAIVGPAWLWGARTPIGLGIGGLAGFAVAVLAAMVMLDVRSTSRASSAVRWSRFFAGNRRRYAAFTMHLAFVCLAIGIAASSLGTESEEVVLIRGETVQWAGRTITFVGIEQHRPADKRIVEARLEITDETSRQFELRPAQHLHMPQGEWTSEVAIDSTWARDFYTIVHGGIGTEKVGVSLIVNPMMRWIWAGGLLMIVAAPVCVWPTRTNAKASRSEATQSGLPSDVALPRRAKAA